VRIVKLIPCAAVLYTDEGTILDANDMLCALLGYAHAELTKRRVDELTAWHDGVFTARSGEAIQCDIETSRVVRGKPSQFLSLVRKRRVDLPRDGFEGLPGSRELILHAFDEGFIVLDPEFRVKLINDEALRIDGRPRSAIIGRTHWEVWPGSEQLPLADAYRKAMRERIPINVEQVYRHNDNDMWLEARAFPFGDGLALLYRNITERKLAERTIRESEAKFRTITDAMPQIVWSTRADGFHDYYNHRWYDYTGVPAGEGLDGSWLDVFHPDDQAAVLERWNRSLATGEPYEAEFRIRHRSGEYRWSLGRALPVRNEQGEIVRWMGTTTDIHDQITTRAELHDTQSRLEAALAAADIGTWTWDVQADLVHADRNLASMLGIPEYAVGGGPMEAFFNVVHRDDVAMVRANVAHAVATGEPCHEYFRICEAGGAIRHMEARGTVVTDASGKALRMSGAVLDVTRQKQADEALRSSELTFRTLADNIPQLAWMAGVDGGIFWYNDRWFSYTGTTLEEMQGWGWTRVHHPDHVERVVALYRERIVDEQRIWEDTFPLRGADGNYRWFLSRAVPIRDEHGAVVRWLGTSTDITLQREAEQALQQANQRKDDFLAMLAHELRNPLAPICTASQLLKMDARSEENVQRSSEIIDRQVKHISDLVNDLMDVSRVTRGLVSIDKEEIRMADVVNDAVEQSRPLIEARRQQLVLDIQDGDDCVLGDRKRLVQVLVNLLNNAAKYTQQGGRIVLAMRARDGKVDISVADNGIGMDANLLPRVFELFAQAERTPDRDGGGLGLGLALVKSIVALHGGSVTASSPGTGLGSTFTVSLPLLRQAEAGAAQPLHILLVDRAEDGDPALPAALEAEGHIVALCPDEPSALESARELQPDAVLIRTDLPDVEGYALARQLHALHPDDHATYIALSDSGQSHDKVIALGAGFDHLLERPVEMGTLRRILPHAPH